MSKSNPGGTVFTPGPVRFSNGKRICKVSFVGDIMSLGDSKLVISSELKDFISDSDYLVGNMESTIRSGKSPVCFQSNRREVLHDLSGIFDPGKTYLSLANNHAGDFKERGFRRSLDILEESGFNLFGFDDRAYADPGGHFRLIGATQWSNRMVDYLIPLDERIIKYCRDGGVNILFPHWGYELRAYPDLSTVESGNKLMKSFDAVIGHHSHTPQPVVPYPDENKLMAYSLGNLCFKTVFRKFFYGLVVNLVIVKDDDGRNKIGHAEWKYIRMDQSRDSVAVKILEGDLPYGDLNSP